MLFIGGLFYVLIYFLDIFMNFVGIFIEGCIEDSSFKLEDIK